MKRTQRVFILLLTLIIQGYNAQENSVKSSVLNGRWLVELKSNDIGTVKTIFNFESSDSTFNAYTRQGADRAILGFWKSTMARIFTDDFKNGSLVRITDGIIQNRNDTIFLAAIFRSSIGSYYFNGTVVNDTLNAKLRNSKKELTGQLMGFKNAKITYPLNDYPKIISEAIDTTKTKIYNRDILETKKWKQFDRKITEKSSDFKDDIELVFAFFYFAKELPISHFALTRVSEQNIAQDTLSKKFLNLSQLTESTALLKITSFSGTAKEVDSIFSEIDRKGYKNLIVDLRDNPGGSVEAGMAFARNVVDTTMIGGIFLTQKWFNNLSNIPTANEYNQFPVFSDANYDLIIQGIHREKGLVLKVYPMKDNYKGKLFIITNNNTASTCEPIVYALKENDRAIIVGKKTAGVMLNGEQFKLPSGFSVFVPTADYYTRYGYRIDQEGVQPNIELKKEDPVQHIEKKLIK